MCFLCAEFACACDILRSRSALIIICNPSSKKEKSVFVTNLEIALLVLSAT